MKITAHGDEIIHDVQRGRVKPTLGNIRMAPHDVRGKFKKVKEVFL